MTLSTECIAYRGHTDCIKLENEHTQVILGHQCGGRVLSYALDGKNVLFEDPAQDGWLYTPGGPVIEPDSGRFDIGPEMIIPRHPMLWLGPWTAEETGPGQVRLTSVDDEPTGVRLIRDFTLDDATSRLTCTQTILNISDRETRWCHWSRTFAKGGGICVVPLSENSRFPRQYLMYEPPALMNFHPEDDHVHVKDGFLTIWGPPCHAKLGIDSYEGWIGYVSRDDLLFVKRFPTYPERLYNEMAALTISIWYFHEERCEIEPIGPMESLAPGASASFVEEWWLTAYPYPSDARSVDPRTIASAARDIMG